MLSLDRQAFVEALSEVPPKPSEMERILAFNRRHQEAGARAPMALVGPWRGSQVT